MNSFIGAKMNGRLHRHNRHVQRENAIPQSTGEDSQNVGNVLGEKSCVRQSKYFRQYESGNGMKSLLGNSNLGWNTSEKEGVFKGQPVYDFDNPSGGTSSSTSSSSTRAGASGLDGFWEDIVSEKPRLQVYPSRYKEPPGNNFGNSSMKQAGLRNMIPQEKSSSKLDQYVSTKELKQASDKSESDIYEKYSNFCKTSTANESQLRGSSMRDILRGSGYSEAVVSKRK